MKQKVNLPMLNVDGQINHLISKGVRFDLISVEDATDYLNNHNNYFKLRAYRKNFATHPAGPNKGKYINLDFAQLKDLAIIDMRMRYVFMGMALDIEHFAKVQLLHIIENSTDDGYQIVESYFDSLKQYDLNNNTHRYDALVNDIERNRNNPYCGGIIDKYNGWYPVWAFVEIITFGTFIHFYGFCSDYLSDKTLKDNYFILLTIKDLRNAAAHSNCIIHDLGAKDAQHNANYDLTRSLSSITKSVRKNQLSNERMRQIATLLFAHARFVTSDGTRNRTKNQLKELIDRINHHIDYYSDNDNITAAFSFFQKTVDIFF